MKRHMAVIAAGLLTTFGVGSSLAQQVTDDESVFYVRTVTCAEITTGSGEASGYAFVFLYGYAAGEMNLDAQTSTAIESTIVAARSLCGTTPDRKALNVFREVMASEESS